MSLLDRITRKCVKSASTAVSDSVKTEVKKATVNAIPALIGIGTVILGLIVFKNPSAAHSGSVRMPSISRMSVVTNNYYFDSSVKSELLTKLIDK